MVFNTTFANNESLDRIIMSDLFFFFLSDTVLVCNYITVEKLVSLLQLLV